MRVAAESVPLVKADDFTLSPAEEQIKYETNRALNRIGILLQQYAAALNNLSLADNIGTDVDVEFGQAGVELSAAHTLNRAPKAIIGIKLDRPGAIYMSQTPDAAYLYLKSDTDSLSGEIYVA